MLDPQQIKIVFFDIDETLYIKNQKTLPASVHTALEGLKRNNIIPAIATGRSGCALPDEIYDLYRVSPMATLLFLLVQKKKAKKHTPVSVLFFAFANFYGQFVNLPLRGFGHDKLTLKSSRKRSGTEDGELKTKCRVLRF
jgi:hydroxymethylpyrimidine pyrophosphatase-like HAD family hydrolase